MLFKHASLRGSMLLILLTVIIGLQYGCGSSSAEAGAGYGAMPPPQLPVVSVITSPVTTYKEFTASLEGKVNVEVRPQVAGYLDKIYVDEGAYVKQGQPLFKINDHIYNEQLTSAKSSLLAAQANMQKAQIEVDRLTPLVENNVIADVQLKTAKSAYEAAKASAEQAKAIVGNAQINVGYTLITAPANGYIGRIPYKVGSLVGSGEAQPLTVLSDVSEMYAYFSLSEPDFIAFKNQFAGNTIEEKLKQVPAAELVLADNSVFGEKGKVGIVEGQFDKGTGAISFRATFNNPGGILRTGNTGRIRIPRLYNDALMVPQNATFDIQDKVFVFVLTDSNKVQSKPIGITGKTASYYLVDKGIKAGEKIVYSGLGNLKDGMPIVPQPISADSLLKASPF
jgi:membrane fusion protein (multidrug efflux system)